MRYAGRVVAVCGAAFLLQVSGKSAEGEAGNQHAG